MPDQSSTLAQPTGAVHPVAALFPMMSEEELDDLAADIAANGLLHPIVLDAEGTLIDGRNRQEACTRAGVEPEYKCFDGNPVAFILSANVNRRHLSKGQRAMAVARACALTNNLSFREVASQVQLSREYVRNAAVVLKYAPEYADAVLQRGMPLAEAYTKAQERKEAAQSDEAKLERLKGEAPDLAELVVDERLTLSGAFAELAERRRKERERAEEEQKRREATTQMVHRAVVTFNPAGWTPEERATLLLEGLLPRPLPDGTPLTDDVLEAVEATVRAMRVLRKEAA